MDDVFKKLNFKDQTVIFAINSPASFDVSLQAMSEMAVIKKVVSPGDEIEFILLFATRQEEMNNHVQQIAPLLKGDALFWICYPKGSSKKYQCDFNRDTGWHILGEYEMEPVRQVAIDEDWSSLRFRKVAYIKTLKRKFDALSVSGKKKAGQLKGR
jgi:hypothetical protein